MLGWTMELAEESKKGGFYVDYLLNDLGIFLRKEERVLKPSLLQRTTGFRAGFKKPDGKDYYLRYHSRDALLWRKIYSVSDQGNHILVRGNSNKEILLFLEPGMKTQVLDLIYKKRREHPPLLEEDLEAADWISWSQDEDWGDEIKSLAEMVEEERSVERFIEAEVLVETILPALPQDLNLE